MGDVLTFTPRPKPVDPILAEPLTGAAFRASLEEAAQTALDAADRIIAVLDRMDGDGDDEEGGDAEPSLAAPENLHRAGLVEHESAPVEHRAHLAAISQDPELGRERAAGLPHAADALEHPISVVRVRAPKGDFQW